MEIGTRMKARLFPLPLKKTFWLKSVLPEKYSQSGWQMLIIRPCVGVRVFPSDAAMSLLQSGSGATPQAKPGRTLRVKRTLLLPIYLSLCQSKTLNVQRFPCSCVGNMQMTSHPCNPLPLCNYIPKNWKRRTNPQASVSTQWDVLLIGDMHECISVYPWMSWLPSASSSGALIQQFCYLKK